jgi:integrase
MARTKLKNIYLRRDQYRVAVRVAGMLHWDPESYPRSTPLAELREKVEALRQQWQTTPAAVDSFADDVQTYLALPAVLKKRSLNQITAHLELWLKALGRDRARSTITTEEVDAILYGWLEAGLTNGTVRKRRTTLRSFFVRMNGTQSRRLNPVQAAVNPKEPAAEDRSIDFLIIAKALATMPVRQSAPRGTLGELALSPIRARVLAYTGLPPGVLMQLGPDDLDLVNGRVYAPGREKGAGTAPRWCELTPEGLGAFKDFHAADAYGCFSPSSLGRSVQAAFRRIGYTRPLRLYDLRHSFLAQMYRATRDIETVGRLGLHVPGSKMTARYAMGANRDVDAAAVQAFSVSLEERRRAALKPAISRRRSARKLANKVSQIR